MIRRAFWLTVGAAGGIMGYRRVAALGQRISGKGAAGRRSLTLGGTIRATRAVRGFSRDVREGMELYSARRPREVGPTLPPASNDNDLTVKDDR
ncbi:MAG TPA: hypothetical protein VHZ03_49480 [Trebonia sp.]|jgi:hypothetical protein|nr:hypothetical protein [Trebonia sp.]